MIGTEINGFLILGLDNERNNRMKLEKAQGKRKRVVKHYLCKCLTCGQIYSMPRPKILNRKSQGCKNCNLINFNKYVGTQINNWTILKYLGNHKFKCRCVCGSVKEVDSYNIVAGLSKDCGCGRKHSMSDTASIESLIGKKYGKLTVLEELGKNKWGKIIYKCRCDCGNTTDVLSNSLRTGHTQSCGCTKSITPSKIKMYLEELGYEAELEHRLNLSETEGMKYMSFDVYVKELNLAIEYDGKPHFEPIDWKGEGIEWAIDNLSLVEYRDKIKEQACYKRGIYLLRIPYTQKENYKDIINETIKIIANND